MNEASELSELDKSAARVLAYHDFYFFCRYMFKEKNKNAWLKSNHHKQICNALMRVFSGDCKRLIINMPPRYSKTELAVVNFIAWSMGRYSDSIFMHTSYTASLAETNARQIRELMQHEEYKLIFPSCKLNNTLLSEFKTTAGGQVYSAGAGGSLTGYGAGRHRKEFAGFISIDDPHKPDEILSKTKREGVSRWYQETLQSRANNRNTPIILTMQRLHVDDLAGFLIGGGSGEKWELLQLSAIDDDENALWHEKHTIEELKAMQAANNYIFAAQYQQKPQLLGGNMIKTASFRLYEQLPKITHRVIFADTAMKTGQQHDYSVLECWGMGDDKRIYLLDMLRGKYEAPDLQLRAIAFWEKHKAIKEVGTLRALKVEDKASGTGLIQTLKAKHGIPVVAVQRNTDKVSRLNDCLQYINSGLVCIPAVASFTNDFLAECEAFSADNSHKHDDQIDPMLDAIQDMLASTNAPSAFVGAYF